MKLLLLLAVSLCGCMRMHYERRDNDGVHTFSAWSFFADEKLSRLSVDKETKATRSGLSIGLLDGEVNTEALNGVTESIVSGVVKGITKP